MYDKLRLATRLWGVLIYVIPRAQGGIKVVRVEYLSESKILHSIIFNKIPC